MSGWRSSRDGGRGEEDDVDLYAILEASPTASYEELRANYRRLALQCHPDKMGRDGVAESSEEFQRIDKAWKTLGDPELRRRYDSNQRALQLAQTMVNDDLDLEDMAWDEDDKTYIHSCRCGGEYALTVQNATGTRIVNCSNCSLSIRVSAVVDAQRHDTANVCQNAANR